MIHSGPKLWQRLMTTLTEVLARYLIAQAEAGADVVQLFDSWLGCSTASASASPWPLTSRR
jgi:uroporphyrinogen decarboxylase